MADKKGKKDVGKDESKEGAEETKAPKVDIVESPSSSKTWQESLPSTSAGNIQIEIPESLPSTSAGNLQIQIPVDDGNDDDGNDDDRLFHKVLPQLSHQESTHSIAGVSPYIETYERISIVITSIDTEMEDIIEDAVFEYALLKSDGKLEDEKKSFRFPIYNGQTFGVYQEFIHVGETYKMVDHPLRKITPELYLGEQHLNVKMFKKVMSFLSVADSTPRLPTGNEKFKARISGVSITPPKVYMNLNRKIAHLLRYVLRISALERLRSSDNFQFQRQVPFDRKRVYFHMEYDNIGYTFTRVKLSNHHEEKLKRWKEDREKQRSKEAVTAVKRAKLYNPENPKLRPSDRQKIDRHGFDKAFEDQAVMFRAVDCGVDVALDKYKVHSLAEVWEPLQFFPFQARRVNVRSLDYYKNDIMHMLSDLQLEAELVWVQAAPPDALEGIESVEISTRMPRHRTMYKSYVEHRFAAWYHDDDDDVYEYGEWDVEFDKLQIEAFWGVFEPSSVLGPPDPSHELTLGPADPSYLLSEEELKEMKEAYEKELERRKTVSQ